MLKSSKRIKIPQKELLFIKPDVRQKLFTEIYKGYSKRYPMKLMYAYLNFDPDLIVDYAIMYSGKNVDGAVDLVLFDIPPIHSDRSTPGYRYCRRTHQEDKFFEYGVDDIITIERTRFNEFITMNLRMSLDKDDPNYWKNPENYKELLQGLLDLSLRYRKRV